MDSRSRGITSTSRSFERSVDTYDSFFDLSRKSLWERAKFFLIAVHSIPIRVRSEIVSDAIVDVLVPTDTKTNGNYNNCLTSSRYSVHP
jgi:hypothetical protein